MGVCISRKNFLDNKEMEILYNVYGALTFLSGQNNYKEMKIFYDEYGHASCLDYVEYTKQRAFFKTETNVIKIEKKQYKLKDLVTQKKCIKCFDTGFKFTECIYCKGDGSICYYRLISVWDFNPIFIEKIMRLRRFRRICKSCIGYGKILNKFYKCENCLKNKDFEIRIEFFIKTFLNHQICKESSL
jgi:hypothetical protein